MIKFRSTYAEIHLRRVQDNFEKISAFLGKDIINIPMVKANAYGHGDIEIVKSLINSGIRVFGVGLLEEGIRLRKSLGDLNSKVKIIHFGDTAESDLENLLNFSITPMIHSLRQLRMLESYLKKTENQSLDKLSIHLKFNTGMNRLGFSSADMSELLSMIKSIKKLSNAFIVEGICTHLAGFDDERQVKKFFNYCKELNLEELKDKGIIADGCLLHVLSSDSVFKFSKQQKEGVQEYLSNSNINGGVIGGDFIRYAVRTGIALYGCHVESSQKILKPVMELKSHIISNQLVLKGGKVSYGGEWQALKDSVIAIVPIGYGDGYPRKLSGKGEMLFRGRRVPIVGRVCMDYTMIDLTEVLNVDDGAFVSDSIYGEEVVLFGKQQDETLLVEEVASLCETISYEILTNIGQRVPRLLINT